MVATAAIRRAVNGAELVAAAYAEAERGGYRRHEFGDSCLLLPGRRVADQRQQRVV